MQELTHLKPEDVLSALRLWHGGQISRWPMAHLRLGNRAMRQYHSSTHEAGPVAKNQAILLWGLTILRKSAPEASDLLINRFEKRQEVLPISSKLSVTEATIHYRQRQAIKQLTDILNKEENEVGKEWQDKMLARLETSTYEKLIGVKATRQRIIEALLDENSHFIAALDGLGGMGKTALADRVTREIIKTTRFDEVAWITAKQTYLTAMGHLRVETSRPALTFPMLIDELVNQFEHIEATRLSQLERERIVKERLREQVCLVVIDNLETVADYKALLPELRKWQNPSKFLLTSRRRLLDESNVFTLSLPELNESAAFELMRLEAQRVGFYDLTKARDEDLSVIYDVVGGNPLALKLMVGQLRFHSLPHTLARLQNNKNAQEEGIFDYIYREVWETINDSAKMTLLALTQSGRDGFTFDHLVAVSGVPPADLSRSLEELVLLSVVDVSGSLFQRCYRLHNLTTTFLLNMFGQS